jgi:hypothetical protein
MNNLTSSELKEWTKKNVEEGLYFEIDDDQYFYFLMGQVTAFIINQTDNKNAASIVKNNILLNASDSKRLKELIIQYYSRTCGDVTLNHKLSFNRALGAIMGWIPDVELNKCKAIFMMGLVSENLLNK